MNATVLSHIFLVEVFVPELLNQREFLGREYTHPDSLHFVIDFPMQPGTCRTSKDSEVRDDVSSALDLSEFTFLLQSAHFLLSGSFRSCSRRSASFLFII